MCGARNIWWGAGLIVIGLLFLLDNAGMIDAGRFLRLFWPAAIVVWGILLLVHARRGYPERPAQPAPDTGQMSGGADTLNSSSVFGDAKFSVSSPAFKGGFVSSVFGNTQIDLSRCSLDSGEQTLSISSVFGDTDVVLPRGAVHAVHANGMFGTVTVKGQHRDGFSSTVVYESPGYASADKKLRVGISQVFGDIHVREA